MRNCSILVQWAALSLLSVLLTSCGGRGLTTESTPANPGTGTSTSAPSGSSSSPSSSPAPPPTPSPTPNPAPTPSPAPSPSPSPNNGNPVASSQAFVAALIANDGSNHGQIAVNTTAEDGQVNLQLKNATPNTFVDVVFCPYPTNSGPMGNGACLAVSAHQYSTDSSGNASATFPFGASGPGQQMASGTWSGIFQVNTQTLEQSGFQMPASGTQFQAALKLCKNTSSLYFQYYVCGTDQLTSGYLTVNGTTVHVSVRGAPAATTFTLSHCDNSSKNPCAVIGTFATDSSGNTDSDLDYEKSLGTSAPAGPFTISRNEGSGSKTEFVTAFTVP